MHTVIIHDNPPLLVGYNHVKYAEHIQRHSNVPNQTGYFDNFHIQTPDLPYVS